MIKGVSGFSTVLYSEVAHATTQIAADGIDKKNADPLPG